MGISSLTAAAPVRSEAGGFGLYSMRERVALFGGRLFVEPLAPGTRAVVRLPATVLGTVSKDT